MWLQKYHLVESHCMFFKLCGRFSILRWIPTARIFYNKAFICEKNKKLVPTFLILGPAPGRGLELIVNIYQKYIIKIYRNYFIPKLGK